MRNIEPERLLSGSRLSHPQKTAPEPLEVAVGVIKRSDGKVLIARRDASLHQGGLWEFPGGKIEAGETPEQALFRELKEELNIETRSATPLISINHRYPDRTVNLRVFLVDRFSGAAQGCQGQPIIWVEPDSLGDFTFPAANRAIVTATQLPPYYAILDDQVSVDLIGDLRNLLMQGIKLLQARLKTSSSTCIARFLSEAFPLCCEHGAALLINSAVEFGQAAAHGLHLTRNDLLALRERPPDWKWVGASCHTLSELEHAYKIGADFAVLGPVRATQTHPEATTLGWESFTSIVERINIPVYALGGLTKEDLILARGAGAQGIASIRAFIG